MIVMFLSFLGLLPRAECNISGPPISGDDVHVFGRVINNPQRKRTMAHLSSTSYQSEDILHGEDIIIDFDMARDLSTSLSFSYSLSYFYGYQPEESGSIFLDNNIEESTGEGSIPSPAAAAGGAAISSNNGTDETPGTANIPDLIPDADTKEEATDIEYVAAAASDSSGNADGEELILVFTCGTNGEVVVEYEDALENVPQTTTTADVALFYRAETSNGSTEFMNDLEAEILATATSSILNCAGRRKLYGETKIGRSLAVSSITSTGSTATISGNQSCDNGDNSPSYCFIVESSHPLRLEGDTSSDEATRNALTAIKQKMDSGSFLHVNSFLEKVAYLGPLIEETDYRSETPDLDEELREPTPAESTSSKDDESESKSLSTWLKGGLILMSVGVVAIVTALVRERRHRDNRKHVALKDDDGSWTLASLSPKADRPLSIFLQEDEHGWQNKNIQQLSFD